MSATMTAYYVERTGHVLAAVTRAAGAGQASRKAPIEEDVLIRISQKPDPLQFPVPGTEISTLVVDPLPALLLRPHSFHAPKETGVPSGTEARPKEVKPLPGLTVSSVELTLSEVRVILSTDAQKDESVWTLIAGGTLSTPLITEGTIAKSMAFTILPIPMLDPGSYQILVLVRERLPFAKIDSIAVPG